MKFDDLAKTISRELYRNSKLANGIATPTEEISVELPAMEYKVLKCQADGYIAKLADESYCLRAYCGSGVHRYSIYSDIVNQGGTLSNMLAMKELLALLQERVNQDIVKFLKSKGQ